MSYLRLIINPEDDSAFLRIINTPKRAIGPVTLEKLGCLRKKINLSLLAAASDQRLTMVITVKKPPHSWLSLPDFITAFTRNLLDDDEPVPIIRQMMNEAGYIDYIKESAATPAQEKTKLDNIEVLYRQYSKFD